MGIELNALRALSLCNERKETTMLPLSFIQNALIS